MVGLPSSGPVGLEGAQWEAQPGSSATYLLFYYSTIQLCTNLLFYYSTIQLSTNLLFYYSTVHQSSFLLCSLLSTTPSQVYFTIPSVLCQSTVPPIYEYLASTNMPTSTMPSQVYYSIPSPPYHAFTLS